MNFDLGTLINVVIAIFTAIAAVAAWRAASIAKSTAKETSKTADEQTNVLITAAKANALASRINFYSEQIAPIRERLQDRNLMGEVAAKLIKNAQELEKQRDHLAYWLDRQTNDLKVGLNFKCPPSPHDSEVPRWRGEQPKTEQS